MKFRFNGDADCPDWILAEIYTLSRLSSIKLKALGQIVIQGIIAPPLQFQKIEKMFAESKLDPDIDLKSCVACLTYLISAATRYSCDSSALQSELQQLGLPREHSNSIKRLFDEHRSALTDTCKLQSLKVNFLSDASAKRDPETGCATLNLDIEGSKKIVTLSPEMVNHLLTDLISVRKYMTDIQEAS